MPGRGGCLFGPQERHSHQRRKRQPRAAQSLSPFESGVHEGKGLRGDTSFWEAPISDMLLHESSALSIPRAPPPLHSPSPCRGFPDYRLWLRALVWRQGLSLTIASHAQRRVRIAHTCLRPDTGCRGATISAPPELPTCRMSPHEAKLLRRLRFPSAGLPSSESARLIANRFHKILRSKRSGLLSTTLSSSSSAVSTNRSGQLS